MRFAALSVLFHGLLLSLIFINLAAKPIAQPIGITIQTYLYKAPNLIKLRQQQSKNLSSTNQIKIKYNKILESHKDLQIKHLSVNKTSHQYYTKQQESHKRPRHAQTKRVAQAPKQGAHQTLLIYLHNLIQQHIALPVNLDGMGISRSVQLEFGLNPEGDIMDPKILRSSGIAMFDSAAMQAIKQISPVQKKYLQAHNQETFIIFIDFS